MLLFFVYARYSLFSLLLIVVVGSCLVTEKILYSEKKIYRRGESYGLGYMYYNQSNRSEKIETTQYRKTAKPAEPPAPATAVRRSTRPVPKAPTSQSSAMSSDPAAVPKTPVKGMCYLDASDIVVEFCYNVGDY